MAIDRDIRLADGDHVVQFYDADDDLVTAVAGYLGAALQDGDAAVVIATPEHREAFDAAMAASGVATHAARASGCLTVIDAADALSQLMVDGAPDPERFDDVVGTVIRQAVARAGTVRAYGEMVSVLWDGGNVVGAIALEELWNSLRERTPYSLFCSYPAHMVASPDSADAFSRVCDLHSHVVAGAPVPEGAEVTARFANSPRAPGLARQFATETLSSWGRPGVVDDVVLVVAELTTNAVIHAGSDFTVGLARRADGGIDIIVGDASRQPPRPRDPDITTPGGRGLWLVDAVARRWGHRAAPEGAVGKLVWAELGGSPAPGTAQAVG